MSEKKSCHNCLNVSKYTDDKGVLHMSCDEYGFNMDVVEELYKEYTPTTGDIVFFQSSSVYNGVSSHTGIVAHCDGEYIYTIEGNRSNRVDVWRIKVDTCVCSYYIFTNTLVGC